MDKSYDQNSHNEIKQTDNLIQPEGHLDKINIHKEKNVLNHAFSDTNNLINMTESDSKIATNEKTEKNFPVLENCLENTILYESGDKDSTHLQADSQFKENDKRYNLNIVTSNGPSTVQTEHLLEMATEVANVLTDDTDNSDPSLFDNDLKCRNQFLTTCLEEQRQLVNDLHIQVSRYVSK